MTKHVPLHDSHIALGGKMVEFAGFEMPIQYQDGIMQEHLYTRSDASVFDVSHMGQAWLVGPDADKFLETLVPSDICGLEMNVMRYTMLLNKEGGVIDDLMVTRRLHKGRDGALQEALFLVFNASRVEEDFAAIGENIPDGITLRPMPQQALLAIQGPKAEAAVAALLPGCGSLHFMHGMDIDYKGVPVFVTRSGYTGEDGFEVSIPARAAEQFLKALVDTERAKPAGLGARDSLRLEAGLCLYGHDLNEQTTPVEANLNWVISKNRSNHYAGKSVIEGQRQDKTEFKTGGPRKLKAFFVEGRAPVREGAEIYLGLEKVGEITSGGFSPTLQRPICIGYVNKNAKQYTAKVRGKDIDLTVTKLPFVEHKYKKEVRV